jgi:hypothetical protein
MKITTVGIDLAKNVFQIHAVSGKPPAFLPMWPSSCTGPTAAGCWRSAASTAWA